MTCRIRRNKPPPRPRLSVRTRRSSVVWLLAAILLGQLHAQAPAAELSESPAQRPVKAVARPAAKSGKTSPKRIAPKAATPGKPKPSALGDKINAILAESDAATQSHIGINIVDLKTGRQLYEHDSARLFAPASTTKLFSTALALSRLGPQHRFVTRITSSSSPAADGTLSGDLVMEGGGDPSLSDRLYPYRPEDGKARAAIEELADQIVSRGVQRITGGIVGDDTLYPWHPYPPGWTIDDSVADYGAPVSALSVYDNTVRLAIRPGAKPGDAAQISVSPALEYYTIDNHVETVSGPAVLRLSRSPGSRQLLLWGTVSTRNGGVSELVAVDDPALFAAQALADALARRGVAIAAPPSARHRLVTEDPEPFDGFVLARRESPPLADLLQVIDKVSQNLHAEIMLREVGRVRRGAATRSAGLDELRRFLAENGIKGTDYAFEDGSGLSRLTMVTPESQTRLLAKMSASKYRDVWMKLLPIAGVDGTLRRRFKGDKIPVYAKTGSLSHVSALAGYVEHPNGLRAFSILVNQSNYPAADVRAMIDKIVVAIVEDPAKPCCGATQ
ncbi:MAG: D-alanyl-D-alanine carboxypeptidase/D-alanyl-D-alanine-endopeptidase [Bryobacteraceae bacterium]